MVTRLGMAVSRDTVTAAIVRGRDVVWQGTEAWDGDVGDTVLQLLRKASLGRWPRPRAHVAVDDTSNRVKILRGLPPVTHPRMLGRVIAATPGRFFVFDGRAAITGVQSLEPGVARAAVLDGDLLDTVQAACTEVGVMVSQFMPAEVALARLSDEERAHPAAAALGATLVPSNEPLAVRKWRDVCPVQVQRWRIVTAVAVAAISFLAFAGLPVLAAARDADVARREIAKVAAARARATLAQRDLQEMERGTAKVADFERTRLSKTMLLAALDEALPAKASLAGLKADSSGVTLVVLAPRAAAVVSAIEELPGASGVTMVGPVTHDIVNGTPIERLTMRFRFVPPQADMRVPLAARRETEGAE